MGTFTRDNTDVAVDLDGVGQQHRAEAGGMVIALERWNRGLDTEEMFAELPDGAYTVLMPFPEDRPSGEQPFDSVTGVAVGR